MNACRSARFLAACALALGAVTTSAVRAAAPKAATFQLNDWELACDNTRTCRAVGYQSDDANAEPLALLVERAAGPGVPPKLQVMLGDPEEGRFPPRARLVIDGRGQGDIALAKGDGTGPLTAAQAAAVLRAVVGTGEVVFEAEDRHWHLSSAGATAVLLRMDDLQGRVGTPGALVRKGQQPESRALQPLAAPVVPPARLVRQRPADQALGERIRPLLRATLAGAGDCMFLTSPEGEPEPIEVQRLSEDRVMLTARCWLAAYNAGSGVWVAADKPPYAPTLVTTMATDVNGNTIEAHHKGRGIGDCWGIEEWTWDGRRFVHTYSATTGMCKMVAAGGAWTLPTVVTAGRKTPGH